MAEFRIKGLAPSSNNNGGVFRIKGLASDDNSALQMPENDAAQVSDAPKTNYLRSLAAGLGNLSQNLLNIPHDLVAMAESPINSLGKTINQAAPQIPGFNRASLPDDYLSRQIPHFNNDYARMLGQKGGGTLMDNLIQGGIGHAPELLSLGLLGRAAAPYLFRRAAVKPYKLAQGLLEQQGVTHIPPNPELVNDASQYFRNTMPNNKMLEGALQGKIKDLFQTQSDLGRIGRGSSRSPFFAERESGRDALKAREALLDYKREQLQNLGLHDAARLFDEGRNNYRIYNRLKPLKYAAGLTALSQTNIPSYLVKLFNAAKG